jgi:serine/threonine protein kinase
MPDIKACPRVEILHQLILGRIAGTEAERLEAHLALCPHCAEALRHLHADDALVEAARGADTPQDATPPDVVQALLPALKRLRSTEDVPTLASAPPSHDTPACSGPGTDATGDDEVPPELQQLGPYRLLRRLGAGGMGVVYLAEDPRLQRQIALKLIKPGLLVRPDAHDRFLREARAAAKVEHENIVTIHEVEEANGVLFLAMPLLKGETLEDRSQRQAGPLSIDEGLHIGRAVAAGLAAAHAAGLIHRDIKPGNIFLESVARSPWSVAKTDDTEDYGLRTTGVRVKILDFGLARAASDDDPGLSHPGAIVGTPSYMAPEQARGLPIDGRADLFSLGCVLYRMVTGKAAFKGTDLVSIMMSAALEQPISPRELNPDVPPELAELILRLLAKSPEGRLPSAHAAEEALRQIEQQRADAARPRPSRRRWLLGAAAAVVAAVSLTAWLLPPAKVPAAPVAVTFDLDAADPRLGLRRGDEEEILFDLRQGRTQALLPGDYAVRAVALPPGRRLMPDHVLVKPEEPVTIALSLVGEIRHTQCERPVTVALLTPSKTELAVLASADGTVRCWDPAKDEPAQVLVGKPWLDKNTEYSHGSSVNCLALSADGRFALSASGDRGRRADVSIRLWDLQARREMAQFVPADDSTWATALAFAPDGRHFCAGQKDGTAALWDIQAHQPIQPLLGHDRNDIHAAAYSADGKRVLTGGGDKRAILWDAAHGKMLRQLEGHTGAVRGVAFAPDGQHAATASWDGTVRIWDLHTGTVQIIVVHADEGAKDGVQAIALAADSQRLLTGSTDGKLRWWDAATGKHLCTLEGHTKAVNSVTLAGDGRHALSASADRTVRYWELPR